MRIPKPNVSVTFTTKSGTMVAKGYSKMMTISNDVFVEFTSQQLFKSPLHFSKQTNPYFFVWHTDGETEVEVLEPRRPIVGTSIDPSCYYVKFKDLYINNHEIKLTRGEEVKYYG